MLIERLYPIWRECPGNQSVRTNFTDHADKGAPAFPLVPAVDYPSVDTMEAALATPTRKRSKDMAADVITTFFDGEIHHHVTSLSSFLAPGGSAA
ncbi:hypothetical protein [Pseudooceanicola sp.]|uniref:hypothetical protein n=1 Tax=Pseudooceanicola sp. TaxID=1914328 RepID=UPI003518B0BA